MFFDYNNWQDNDIELPKKKQSAEELGKLFDRLFLCAYSVYH